MHDPDQGLPPAAPQPPAAAPRGPLATVAFGIGALGLVAATLTDSLAVLGRHTGFGLLGSIEIVQAAVVLAACGAVLLATATDNHAAVHMLTDRLRPGPRAALARLAALLSALFFLAMAFGSAWLLADLWSGFERTELLGLPLRWLRLLWIAAALGVAALFLARTVRRAR